MKMFKLEMGGKGYLYTSYNGEYNHHATDRITQVFIDDGTIEADGN